MWSSGALLCGDDLRTENEVYRSMKSNGTKCCGRDKRTGSKGLNEVSQEVVDIEARSADGWFLNKASMVPVAIVVEGASNHNNFSHIRVHEDAS